MEQFCACVISQWMQKEKVVQDLYFASVSLTSQIKALSCQHFIFH